MTTALPSIAPWVETHTEVCRNGRTTTVAVNRRDGRALLLDDPDACLHAELAAGGFLAGRPQPVAAPSRTRLRTFLRTFDVQWSGADRLVRAVHDRIAHRFWRPRWLAAQTALLVAGLVATIHALRADRPLELRPTSWHLPAYVALSLLAVMVHELGHGVVLSHHRRRVSSVGFRLHLGSPAFYVESVEAFLLTRRQRLTQAAAGLWAECQLLALVALVLFALPETELTPVLHRFVVLSALTALTNLLPFAGLDGALLFADLVREPNLASDAGAALQRARAGRQPGDGLLVAYAVANTIVSTLLFASSFGLWYLVFGRAVASLVTHGPLGLLTAALILTASFGPAIATAIRWMRRFTRVDRVLFRLERERRVTAAVQYARHESFAQFDERALCVLAGQLGLGRASGATPFYVDGFSGFVAVDRAAILEDAHGTRQVDAGVHVVHGPGIIVRPGACGRRVQVALLSDAGRRTVERQAS